MSDAPERIWAAKVTETYGEWQTVTDGLPSPTEYIRAGLKPTLAEALELPEVRVLVDDATLAVSDLSSALKPHVSEADHLRLVTDACLRLRKVLRQIGGE